MRRVLSALAFAAVAALTQANQSFAADTQSRLTSAKFAEILTALTGKAATVTKPEAGVEVVSIADNGSYDFVMSDCTAAGCPSVQMTMFFNKEDIFTLALVNSYNSKYLGAQAFLTPDNRVYLVRLFITEGGVTEDNIKANIALYLSSLKVFAQTALSQSTASLPAPGVPVAMSPQTQNPPAVQFIERVLHNLPRGGHNLVQVK